MERMAESYFSSYSIKLPTVNEKYSAEGDPGGGYVDVKNKILTEPYFILE